MLQSSRFILVDDVHQMRAVRQEVLQRCSTMGTEVGIFPALLNRLALGLGIQEQQQPSLVEEICLFTEVVADFADQEHPLALNLQELLTKDTLTVTKYWLKVLTQIREGDSLTPNRHGSDPMGGGEISQILAGLYQFLFALAREYGNRLTRQGYLDEILWKKKILETLLELGFLQKPVERLDVRVSRLTPLENRLLAELVKKEIWVYAKSDLQITGAKPLPTNHIEPDSILAAFAQGFTSFPAKAEDDSCRLVSTNTVWDEMRAVVNHLWELKDQGVEWENIAIVCSDRGYLSLLSTTVNEQGIPFWGQRIASLANDPLVQVLQSYLRLLAGQRSFVDLASLIMDEGCNFAPRGKRESLVSMLSTELPLNGRELTTLLTRFSQECYPWDEEERNRIFRTMLQALEPIIESWNSAPPQNPTLSVTQLTTAWAHFRGLVLKGRRRRAAIEPNTDFQAAAAIEQQMEQLLAVADGLKLPASAADWWIDQLRSLLGEQVVEDKMRLGVHLALEGVSHLNATHVLLVGTIERSFPTTNQGNTFLGSVELKYLQGFFGYRQVMLPAEESRWAVNRFKQLLLGVEKLTAFYPQHSISGEKVLPSSLVDSIGQLIHDSKLRSRWERKNHHIWQEPKLKDYTSPRTESEYRRAFCETNCNQGNAVTPEGIKVPGILDKVSRFCHSPTSLETLLNCRFKFWARYLLGLADINQPHLPEDVSPLFGGKVAHRLVEVALQEETELSPKHVGENFPKWFRKAILHSAPFLLLPNMQSRYDGLASTCHSFLKRFAEFLSGAGISLTGVEVRVGYPEPLTLNLPGDIPLRLRGRVDLLGELAATQETVVMDFKWWDVTKYRKHGKLGQEVQMALYMAGLATHGDSPVLGVYYSINKEDEAITLFARDPELALRLGFSDESIVYLEDAQLKLFQNYQAVLEALAEEEITPLSLEKRGELADLGIYPCRYCEYKLLCRVGGELHC